MEPQLKQRVVGAAVMVALAVIFVPMLLDRGPAGPDVAPPRDLAPMPADDNLPSPLPIDPTVETEITTGLTATPEELAARVEPPIEASPANTATPQPAHVTVPPVASPAATRVPAPPATAPTAGVPEPAPITQQPAKTSVATDHALTWVVQLGSFASEDNAKGLLAKLHVAGFTAFIAPLRTAGKQSFRVRVGPTTERTEAERLHTHVQQQLGYSGMVVRNE